MYKCKYLEDSLTAWPPSKITVVGSPLEPVTPHQWPLDQVYIPRHKVSPGEQSSNSIRQRLATPITAIKLLWI